MVHLDVSDQARLLDAVRRGSDQELRELPSSIASEEKILPQRLAALAAVGDGAAGEQLRLFILRQDELVVELEQAAVALQTAGVPFLLLRGFALQQRYPKTHIRQFNDLDLVVRDVTHLPTTIVALGRLGHHLTRPVTAWSAPAGVWTGLAFNKERGRELPFYVDVAAGGPALGCGVQHRIPDSAWASTDQVSAAANVRTLGLTHLTVAFLVELVERDRCIVRDALDFIALIDADGFDPDAVAGSLAGIPVRQGLQRLLPILRASAQDRARRLAARFAAAAAPRSVSHQVRGTVARTLGSAGQVLARHRFDMALRLASDRIAVSAAVRTGLPVFLFPDPDRSLPGLPGAAIHASLDCFTARVRPMATEAETEYCFSGEEWWR